MDEALPKGGLLIRKELLLGEQILELSLIGKGGKIKMEELLSPNVIGHTSMFLSLLLFYLQRGITFLTFC